MYNRKRWSWAASSEEAETFRAEARRLVGRRIDCVRYFDIDYRAEQYRHGEVGPRAIESAEEWIEPTWTHSACHSVDYAVELDTVDGARFTVSWDAPGTMEGLGLRELPAIGNAFRDDADVAMWDVSETSHWTTARESEVTSVELHYEQWDSAGALWCSRITVQVGASTIDFVLGEGDLKSDRVAPSADTVAVIFDGRFLPSWLTDRSA